ncbi:7825_t:CDS:2 [Dentiscutata erythropus]|uniref:7825_t:CDS:1 n=1 Tax=Dentiscutata erythropus TaxID=1348616 RepID=A0A9N8VNY8_9GLOM|nr:7825_t:CDS:2 [Dentiscutata erythropus]
MHSKKDELDKSKTLDNADTMQLNKSNPIATGLSVCDVSKILDEQS